MPATATVVAQVNSDFGTPAQTRTTGSFTPTANSKLVVVAGSVDATHATAKSWTVSGGGLSWASHDDSADYETPAFDATLTTWGMTIWWADVGGSPSSMTVTVDPHATTDEGFIGITVFEVLGATVGVMGNAQASVDGFGTNPTPVSVSLGSSLTANSVVLGGWFLLSDGGTSAYDGTVPSGWSRTLITEVAGVSVAGMISTTENSLTYGSSANTSYTSGFLIEVGEASAAATLDQEGFRWGVDDDTEADHTWAAAQDADLTAALGSQLLRVLVDATNDPASVAYTLRAQQNGAGGYVAVPVGAGGDEPPLIEAGDVTTSGSNTAQSSWAVSTPAASTGDLLVMCLGWDDSVTTSDATPANGPNGETWTRVGAVVASASTEVRATVWRTIATGSWSAGTVTVTPTATESWLARVIKVVAGEFDATTPIGAADEVASAGTTETGVDSPALTAGSSDGGGTLVNWSIADTDPQTVNGSGWTGISTQDIGAHSCALAVRDAATTDSESISSVQVATIAGDSWCSVGFIVRGVSVTNELYVAASANITAGGEATTARLTAPSGKSSSDFTAGRRWDDENGTDSIDIAADFYTEVEWSLATQAPATDGDYWDFRVYAGASPLDTYTEEPRWTIGTGAVELTASTSSGATVAGTATRTAEVAAATSSGGTLAATATRTAEVVASTSSGATLAATGAVTKDVAADTTSSATLIATGARVAELTASTSAGATLAAVAARTAEVAAATSSGATLAGTAARVAEVAASTTAGATLAAEATRTAEVTASTSSGATLAGSATVGSVVDLAAATSSGATVAADAARTAEVTAATSSAATLTGTAARTAEVTAATSSGATLTGDATVGVVVDITATTTSGATLTATAARTAEVQADSSSSATLATTADRVAELTTSTTSAATLTGAAARVAELAASTSSSATLAAAAGSIVDLTAGTSSGATLAGTAARTAEVAAATSSGATLTAVAAGTAELVAATSSAATLTATLVRTAEVAAATSSGATLAATFNSLADPNPITMTIRDAGHTVSVSDDGHTVQLRDAGHTATTREQR